jgi:rare lipoprotein A
MHAAARSRLTISFAGAVALVSGAFLAGCAAESPKSMVHSKTRTKEYFSSAEYGVPPSPIVSTKRSRLPRGGGRDQIGKPYKIHGKWYYPKEDKHYEKVGRASWYGSAFHGRLTANGEVYDMTHLTAAHPTMPLPSYARVTNLANGSSVVVRVNDRGPYAGGRIIDLSKRAAEMLDYASDGVAKVKVEYVSRAPLDGHDEQYLMASYHPGNRAPDPSDGLPTGVMIAMNGPTPSADVGASAPFPGKLADVAPRPVVASLQPAAFAPGDPLLPDLGPAIPERPENGFGTSGTQVAFATLSYADNRVRTASDPFTVLGGDKLTADGIVSSWKRQNPEGAPANKAFVAAGTFETRAEADRLARALADVGHTSLEKSELQNGDWYTLNVYPENGKSLDDVLQAAWASGATDAIAVRN